MRLVVPREQSVRIEVLSVLGAATDERAEPRTASTR